MVSPIPVIGRRGMAQPLESSLFNLIENFQPAWELSAGETGRANFQDEHRWNSAFQRSQRELVAAARRAKQEVAAGKAEVMNASHL